MSIAMYKAEGAQYFYCVEIGGPPDPVSFGEADSPAGAVRALQATQYQGGDLSCRFPANGQLAELFDIDLADGQEIGDCSDEEQAAAEAAHETASEEEEEE